MRRLLGWGVLVAVMAASPAVALEKPKDWVPPRYEQIPNFREQARNVVEELSTYAKKRNPAFQVLMRGGGELLVKGEVEIEWDEIHDPGGSNFIKRLPLRAAFRPLIKYLDGVVLDGIYCGPFKFDKPLDVVIKERRAWDAESDREKKMGIHRPPTPVEVGPFSNDPAEEMRKAAEIKQKQERAELQRRKTYAIDAMRSEGRSVLTVESCETKAEMEAAYRGAARDRVTAYVKQGNGPLDDAPRVHPSRENPAEVLGVGTARNLLPILRSDRFATKGKFITALENTNYDIVVVDVAHRGGDLIVKSDVQKLKYKNLGARRLVLAVMPIGRAFDWRWYWQKGWDVGNPPFLYAYDDDPGTFITDIGSGDWKGVLAKYLTGIIDLGFDGVMFDDVGTYLWFEELMPLDK
ncbi:conserved exported hypothetical protein [Candidatus Terasakiella magnetica]|nr:conserved exported hypothetical protein [Candidatus Terasakiella magnetica]